MSERRNTRERGTVRALINTMAGGALAEGAGDLTLLLTRAFQDGGSDIDVRALAPGELDHAISTAVEDDVDLLIVAGGDGTIRSAARAIAGTNVALGIVPLGTFNRLSRELGIPLDPDSAIRALVSGKPIQIDVARVNDRIFLCNSILGLPTRFSEERQALRGRSLGDRISGYFEAILTVLNSGRRIRISVDDGYQTRALRVLSLAVSNNPYDTEPGFGLQRRCFRSGKLGLYVSRHTSGLKMLWIALQAIVGIWPEDPKFDHGEAQRLIVNSNRKRLKLSNDGELEVLATPLRYQIEPKALKVVVPA